MDALKEIFSEYVSMRERGLKIEEALSTLRPYIAPLSRTTRVILAQQMRDWEKQPPPPEPQSAIGEQVTWLTCPHCNKKNRKDAIFCYACGLMIEISAYVGTKHFTDHLSLNNEYFGTESVLILKVSKTDIEFEVRPQIGNKNISIGRSVPMSTMMPDVDLSEAGAEIHGVSRLHMSVNYDVKMKAIRVQDLGSANGSFINGQKLHPDEVRVLRNGDEIRLGRLIMRADFYHPGEEI